MVFTSPRMEEVGKLGPSLKESLLLQAVGKHSTVLQEQEGGC